MCGFKAVIAHGASRCETDVNNRCPPLKLMMSVMVEQIRNPDGRGSARRFDDCEGGMIVHHFVGEQDFLAATTPHIERGEIVKRARGCYAGEEPIVGFIPKSAFTFD